MTGTSFSITILNQEYSNLGLKLDDISSSKGEVDGGYTGLIAPGYATVVAVRTTDNDDTIKGFVKYNIFTPMGKIEGYTQGCVEGSVCVGHVIIHIEWIGGVCNTYLETNYDQLTHSSTDSPLAYSIGSYQYD